MNNLARLRYILLVFLLTFYGSAVLSQESDLQRVFTGQSLGDSMMDSFVQNYMGIEQLGTYLISLFLAIILATILAFHPQTYGKKEDLDEIEAPKSFIFYAMIGSLIGATVADYGPQLGFIFFGLGGLMRFRSNSGSSVQTGRLILVALIGLCCGLKMLYIAMISTVVAWILIYFLERRTIYQIEVKGIKSKLFLESVNAYRLVLKKQKCNIITEKKNLAKSKVSFIFSAPSKLRRDNIEQFLERQIPEEQRGSLDWNVGSK